MIRVANFGRNVIANLKIDGRTVANIVRVENMTTESQPACFDYLGRAEQHLESADLDYGERAARRDLHLHCHVGFRPRLSTTNDLDARGDGEIGTVRRLLNLRQNPFDLTH